MTLTSSVCACRGMSYTGALKSASTHDNRRLVDEVRHLLDKGIPTDCQAMKAIGYQELALYLQGQMPLDDAVARIKTRTRRFAKRQLTCSDACPTSTGTTRTSTMEKMH